MSVSSLSAQPKLEDDDELYVNGINHNGDREDDEICGGYRHIDANSDDEFICGP